MASDAKNSTPWTGRSRSSQSSRDRPRWKRPPAPVSPPPLTWRPFLFGGTRVTTRSTTLCSSERIFASFRGSRLTPESSSKSSDLGVRIHSVPRSSRRHGAQAENGVRARNRILSVSCSHPIELLANCRCFKLPCSRPKKISAATEETDKTGTR
jgi:hypothetical protein